MAPMRQLAVVLNVLTLLVLAPALAAEGQGRNWPSFRGPQASGIAEGYATPVKWNVEKSENLLFKTPIPGLGHSSPVIWGDRVCVTTAVSGKADPELKVGLYGDIDPVQDDTRHQFKVLCLDKKSGKVLWERTAYEGVPKIRRHTKASHANSTPAIDGKHVVAMFGAEGLYVYDMQGNLLWKKDLGLLDSGYFEVPEAQWGFGSSPVIWGDRVIVQCDVQKGSFLAAFALSDGKELWRVAREEVPTWSTPTVHVAEERAQIIVNGFKHVGGYDPASGRELWRMAGAGDIPVPTPVVGHGMAFITHAHRGSGLWAVRIGASGDITPKTSEGIAWSARAGSYMQTPLVYGDHLYVCRDNGVLSVHNALTGERLHQSRFGDGMSGFTASAVAGDGKVYYTSEMGQILVLQAGPQPTLLATNELGEIAMATPAISEGTLYFRTQGHLVAIGAR